MKLTYKALLCGTLMTASAAAMALPVTGGVSFGANAPGSGFDESEVRFGTNPNDDGNAQVTDASGDYANYFQFGDTVEFNDFQYDPFVSSPQLVWFGSGSVDNTVMSFYLEDLDTSDYTGDTLTLKGTGYLLDDSMNQVDAVWNYTANESGKTFSWSASTAVPEPGTLALLGLGLAGLGAARRRQKAA